MMWYVIGWTIVTLWLLSKLGVFKKMIVILDEPNTTHKYKDLCLSFVNTARNYFDLDKCVGYECWSQSNTPNLIGMNRLAAVKFSIMKHAQRVGNYI